MKERPILFSAPMVRAILNGSKTQTRRVIKPQPYIDNLGNFNWNGWCFGQDFNGPHIQAIASPVPSSKTKRVHCPYGKPGDQLWVRETWAEVGTMDPGLIVYRADYPYCVPREYQNVPPIEQITWKPSIHMPRIASRIQLEITGIRVERLQDISEVDAKAEGGPDILGFEHDTVKHGWQSYREWYLWLWETINGEGSWSANPWVWIIEFRRIKP